eukprot:scaffold8141_cov139-Skeletonema_dohrnii-CCMP3373.AAC.16
MMRGVGGDDAKRYPIDQEYKLSIAEDVEYYGMGCTAKVRHLGGLVRAELELEERLDIPGIDVGVAHGDMPVLELCFRKG